MLLCAQVTGGAGTTPVSPRSLVIAGGVRGAGSAHPRLMAPRSHESQSSPMPGGAGTQGWAARWGFAWAMHCPSRHWWVGKSLGKMWCE